MDDELKTRLIATIKAYRETCGDEDNAEADDVKRECDYLIAEVEALDSE